MTPYVLSLLRKRTCCQTDAEAEIWIVHRFAVTQAAMPIARELSVAPQYIRAILKKHGLTRGRGGANNPRGRSDHCHRIQYQGHVYSCAGLARLAGVSTQTMHVRLFQLGWDVDRAVTTPRREKE